MRRCPGLRDLVYDMPAGPPIHCTVTELKVFVPLWFRNQWLADSMRSSGLTPEAYAMMVRAHRALPASTSDADLIDWIKQGYQDAEQQIHGRPSNEHSADITINGFVHDNVRAKATSQRSPPVIFKDLANGLK